MESIKLLPTLQKLPGEDRHYDIKDILKNSERMRNAGIAIEVGLATEIGLRYVFDELNVNDALKTAYEQQYPQMSDVKNLYQKAVEANEAGVASMDGLVRGIKGKFFEVNLEEKLESLYPGWDFSIAEKANQPIWDLKGIGPDGQELLVQAKMGGVGYAADVKARMLENPDVLFATSTEIQEKILATSPELAEQFIDMDISSAELTENVGSGLEQLMENFGIDAPDDIGGFLPFVGEIVAGIKLLVELSKVKNDYKGVDLSDKRRIQGLRAIMAFSRFGITSVVSLCGGALGTAIFPGVGSLFGGLIGAGAGMYINNNIKPHMHDWALMLMDLTQEEMVYLKNKLVIDKIGERLQNMRLLLS